MKRKLRDWMLDREADAGPRLDALRRQLLEPGLTIADVIRAVFRPATAWATLALVWIALLLTNRAVNRKTAGPRWFERDVATTTLAAVLPDEAPAPLDPHS